MSAADVEQALELLKSNYVNADALNDTEIERAKLEGVLLRLREGAVLTSDSNTPAAPTAPFYSDFVGGHVGYLRIGDLNRANLDALDTSLQSLTTKKIDAAIIDLRASTSSSDFEIAADVAKRFCPKGATLFSLRKAGAKQERTFSSDRDPTFQGVTTVLVDGDTSGAAEALAGALRLRAKALVIGAPTAGRAVQYSDLKLNGGRMLRVAVAQAVLPEAQQIFPGGVKPDIAIEMPAAEKREIFQQSRDKGMAPFLFEPERPHLNEASLMSGRNPEIEAVENAQRRGRSAAQTALHDVVAQRALDVITSISVYAHR